MRAFKVFLNGKKLCLAGVGDGDGVLSTTVVYAPYGRRRHMEVRVGGLFISQGEHVEWGKRGLHVGDELRLKVVECESVDEPRRRHLRDPVRDAKNEKRYVSRLAKKLGWKIIRPGN